MIQTTLFGDEIESPNKNQTKVQAVVSVIEGNNIDNEKVDWEKAYQKRVADFEALYKYGSTTVFLKDGKYFFCGDIEHCGNDAIFHNARAIKNLLLKSGCRFGHMSYNDPPVISRYADWDKEERERKKVYRNDLYVFEGTTGDEIKIADLIGDKPQEWVYCKDDNDRNDNDEGVMDTEGNGDSG